MDLARFSVFKYPHAGRGFISPARRRFIWISSAVAAAASVLAFPVGFVAWLLPLIARISVPKKLYIGPRYLICGSDIVYFHNVTRLALDETGGKLVLEAAGGKGFALEREKFPTNARKDFKIKANRAAKFEKVSTRLIDQVLKCAEEVQVEGLSRKKAQAVEAAGEEA